MRLNLSGTPEAAAAREEAYARRAWLYKLIFIISGLCLALLNSFNSLTGLFVTVLPKLALLLIVCFPLRMLPYAFRRANYRIVLAAAALCLCFLVRLVVRYSGECPYPLSPAAIRMGYNLLAVAAFPALLAYAVTALGYAAAALAESVRRFVRGMDRIERGYLIVFCAVLAVATVLLYSRTGIFHGGAAGGEILPYDVIYTSDSGSLVQDNAYMGFDHAENDLRQPLFALFAMPFALPLWCVSKLLFFVPNLYAILLNIVQIGLIGLSALLLGRMMALEGVAKIGFLALFSLLYPTLLYAFTMEQYVFAVFYLLCFLYLALTGGAGRDVLYIAMTGSLITSGICFPLIPGRLPFKDWLRALLRCALLFFAVVLVFNRQHLFMQIAAQVDIFARLSGNRPIAFADKLPQYLNMLSSCFVRPAAEATLLSYPYPSWQMLPVTQINPGGLVVLALSALGLVLNWKKPFARICGAWVLLSFVLHGLAGWGVFENGLILYAYYYSWAFLCLIFMGLERLLKPLGVWRLVPYGLCCAALVWLNIPALSELVAFGLQYYPL